MAPWRMVVIGLVVAFFGLGGWQLLFFLGHAYSWWVALAVTVVCIAGIVALVRTSPHSAGGTARIVFDHAGIAVLPLAIKRERKAGERWAVCTFSCHETIELSQVSDTWAKLKVRGPTGSTLFSGGIQLPRERENEVRETLKWIITGDPTTPPPLPTNPPVVPPPRINGGYPPSA